MVTATPFTPFVPASSSSSSRHAGHAGEADLDRRDSFRARLAVPLTLTAGGRLLDGTVTDISQGGVRVIARGLVAPNAEVSLVFFLDGDIVSARGVVEWCEPAPSHAPGMATFGVRFTTIEDDGEGLVARFCRSSVS